MALSPHGEWVPFFYSYTTHVLHKKKQFDIYATYIAQQSTYVIMALVINVRLGQKKTRNKQIATQFTAPSQSPLYAQRVIEHRLFPLPFMGNTVTLIALGILASPPPIVCGKADSTRCRSNLHMPVTAALRPPPHPTLALSSPTH